MFYFIIAIAIAGIVCYATWADTASLVLGIIGALFVGIGVFFGSVAIGILVTSSYDTPNSTTQNIVYDESIPLVALKDNMNIYGNIFVFSSTVNETLKYNYITEDEFGQHADAVNADKCYIVYGDEPSIQRFINESKSKVVNWLFCPGRYFYIITLPEGSVIENEYEVDLE